MLRGGATAVCLAPLPDLRSGVSDEHAYFIVLRSSRSAASSLVTCMPACLHGWYRRQV